MTKALPVAALLFAAALPLSPTAASAREPIEGTWRKGTLVIQIAPCGTQLCGTVIGASASQRAKALRGSGTALIGARLIHSIVKTGPNAYRAKVFAPDRNIHAGGTVVQRGADKLEVRGCIAGIFCKTREWTRVG